VARLLAHSIASIIGPVHESAFGIFGAEFAADPVASPGAGCG